MPFSKGLSGNPKGRKKGAKGKTPEQFRELISAFLITNWKGMQKDFNDMEPKDRNRFRESLLKYKVPPELNPERLSESQLLQVLEYLKQQQNEKNT